MNLTPESTLSDNAGREGRERGEREGGRKKGGRGERKGERYKKSIINDKNMEGTGGGGACLTLLHHNAQLSVSNVLYQAFI